MATFRPSANFRFAGDPDVTRSLHPRGWPFLRDLLLLGTCNSDLFFTSIRWTMPDPDESLYGRDVSHQYGVEIVSACWYRRILAACTPNRSARNGAPSDVHALAQTTDGFPWLGP